ncbi:MAG: inner membrane CreD family protein, partial [Sphingobacteriaceae bacterium]
MEENNPQPEDQSTSTKEESVFGKYHIIIKSVIIFILLLVFIIPQVIINGLISERENNQAQAFYDISNKWSGRQTITGPILSIP